MSNFSRILSRYLKTLNDFEAGMNEWGYHVHEEDVQKAENDFLRELATILKARELKK